MEIKVSLTTEDYAAIANAVAAKIQASQPPSPATTQGIVPLMVSKKEATHLLGIPEVMLRQAVLDGIVREIAMPGSAGCQYRTTELQEFVEWAFTQQSLGKLSPNYISKLAQSQSDHECFPPTHPARRRSPSPATVPAKVTTAQSKRAARDH